MLSKRGGLPPLDSEGICPPGDEASQCTYEVGTRWPSVGTGKPSGAGFDATGADVSVVFVPPRFTKSAVVESVDAGIPLIIVITEGVPVRDTAEFFRRMETPVDFEKEVGGDNTAQQAGVLGRVALVYGASIVMLMLVPNTLADRLSILACALIPLAVGFGLRRYARRVGPAAP